MADEDRKRMDRALTKVRDADWHRQAGDENPPSEERLRAIRAACTSMLKLTPEQRQKVLKAAEALG